MQANHLKELRASGLSDQTIEAAGVRSAAAEEVRQILGRSKSIGPGLIFEYPSSNGAAPFSRVKPDEKQTDKDGKAAKYLTAAGAGNRLYLPATLDCQVLDDISIPLLITEGEKKTLSAIQAGFSCMGLAGVWCWKGKDKAGQSAPLPDLDAIVWKDRLVYIVFDSDLVENPSVQNAEAALAHELGSRGAEVYTVRLPGSGDGNKMGLDDYLVAHGPEALQALLDAAKEPCPPELHTGPYRVEGGCIGYMKTIGRGDDTTEVFVPLCNFNARVIEDRALDNGLEVTRRFAIELCIGGGRALPCFEVTAAQFSSMTWVVREAGVKARISAGQGSQDRLREAIQMFSTDVKEVYAYAHTGWRKIDESWQYLHSGRSDVQVVLEPPLDRYALPEEPKDVAGALSQSLALLEVAPDTVTIPLLSCVYLAPLCEFLHPDFVVFLVGKTGSLKSTLAALFLSHYGSFDRTSLPGSWESTDNALERRLSTLKDTLCIVDDYAPRADAFAQRKQAQRAQRIIRSMGNLSGRSRLKADLSERPEYIPRGLMVSTGEDLPPGQSILARILSVEVDREQLDLAAITQAQKSADQLSHAMAGYIDWLTPQLDELAQELREQWSQHRISFDQNTAHLRIPEILAYLALGMDLFTSYAQDLGLLTEEEVPDLAQRAQRALLELGTAHGQRVVEEDPAEVFLSTLSAMLAQGAISMAERNSYEEPEGKVGWKDTEYAYLIPDAVKHAVGRYLRESGGHFPYSARALNEALDGRGALVKGSDGKGTRLVKLGGKNRRVLQVRLAFLEPDDEEAEKDR